MAILTDDELISRLTPEQLAEAFCNLDSAGQARFFNHVDAVASNWKFGMSMQLQYITDDDGLTLAGRRVMQHIGEYSHWGLRTGTAAFWRAA